MVRAEDLILVSVDDHVVEPPDLFDRHLPARWRDRAPRVVRSEDGIESWVFEGRHAVNLGLNAVAGRVREEYNMDPTSFDEIRVGCYEIEARVRDMDANGQLGSMCFPSFPQFCGQFFARADDKDLALSVVKAYNDWHVDDWCGAAPGRFIPLGLVPLWDPAAMADEVRRLSTKGCHAVAFSENPAKLRLPSIYRDHWDPFWAACEDEGTIVCLHLGSSSTFPTSSPDTPIEAMITLVPMNLTSAAADLVFSPVMRKFPTLKFALSEGGIGWLPYFLERIDYVWEEHRAWTGQDFGGRLPSEVFRERVVGCFIDDAVGVAMRDRIGIDMICWECDYPHADSVWPRAPEAVMRYLDGVSDDDVAKITHLNAMHHFRYDPFAVFRPSDCTAAALRSRAVDVDTTPRSMVKTVASGAKTMGAVTLRGPRQPTGG